ncbi:MAG: SRPBCC family protein [Candidatus Kapaibacterium sp.]
MKQYQATDTIEATPEKIWKVLTEASGYQEWDPYCERIEGKIALGEKIKAYTTLSPGRAFPVKVSEFTPNRKMVWTGGMPLGLFKGVRTFSLTPQPNGSTTFRVEEVFTGPMLKLIGKSLPDMTEPFQKFVEGLKRRAEERM